MKLPPINWPVYLFGFAYWVIETSYFGWNALPGSSDGVIAAGIAFLIFALSLACPPKARPVLTVRRLYGPNREQRGVFITIADDIEIRHGEDLQA